MIWGEWGSDKIRRADLNGANVEDLVTGLACVQFITLGPDAATNPWTDLGNGLAGSSGMPALLCEGTLIAGDAVRLTLSNTTAGSTGLLVIGLSAVNTPIAGGLLVPSPTLLLPIATDGAGELTIATHLPIGVPVGTTIYLQNWLNDIGGPFGWSASNAVLGTKP